MNCMMLRAAVAAAVLLSLGVDANEGFCDSLKMVDSYPVVLRSYFENTDGTSTLVFERTKDDTVPNFIMEVIDNVRERGMRLSVVLEVKILFSTGFVNLMLPEDQAVALDMRGDVWALSVFLTGPLQHFASSVGMKAGKAHIAVTYTPGCAVPSSFKN
jgi:hypothetical protein